MKRPAVLAGTLAIVFATFLVGSVSAATPTVSRGGSLVWDCPQSNFTTLDPALNTKSVCQRGALRTMYDTLIYADGKGHLLPQAATSWKISDHGLLYTFQIRPGMKFHDGSPVTAADVKYSILRALKFPLNQGGYFVGVIKRVSTPTPMTLRISLFARDYPILDHLAEVISAPIVNQKVVDAHNGAIDSVDAGSGPFVLTSVNNGTNGSASFVRFANYWEKAPDGKAYPLLDSVRIDCVVDSNTRILNLRSNTAQFEQLTPVANIKDLAQGGYREVNEFGGAGTTMLMNEAVSPFDNALVRRAVVEAIDIPTIAKTWSLGTATVRAINIAGFYDPGPGVKMVAYNPDQAKADLAKAGYPNGFTVTDTIINQQPDQQVSQILQQYLKAVGITLNIRTLDRATWLTETALGKSAMFQQAGNVVLTPDLLLDRYSSGGLSWQRDQWNDGYLKTAHQAMINAEKEADPVKRKAYYKILTENSVAANIWVYLGNAPSPGFANAKYSGFVARASGEMDVRHVEMSST
jgi:peptide/nickel transport system substrate-binding protein